MPTMMAPKIEPTQMINFLLGSSLALRDSWGAGFFFCMVISPAFLNGVHI